MSQPTPRRIRIYFEEEDYQDLQTTSDETGDSLSIIISKLIKRYLPDNYIIEFPQEDK